MKEETGKKEELYSDSGEENEEDSEVSVDDVDKGKSRVIRTSSTQCKKCGKCFKSVENLRIHMKLHLGKIYSTVQIIIKVFQIEKKIDDLTNVKSVENDFLRRLLVIIMQRYT